MAPKRANPIEIPPSASSNEEEEEEVTSSGEEEEGSSSEGEEEEEPQTPLTLKNPPPKSIETATPSTANEDSEESGSESESESDTPKLNAKPIATKPVVGKAASSSKRPPESSQQEDKEAKRPKKITTEEEGSVKKSAGGAGEDGKKNIFQRLFSEEDEIALLKGMLDYSATKKGADPNADMNAFYDFVKKSIHADVTKAQVIDKIRRLKKKFENNAGKGKEGEDPNFSKAHEFNAFKLSKKIWGEEGISVKVESLGAKSNGKAKGNNKAIFALKAADSVSSPNKKVVVDGGVKVEGGVTPILIEIDNNNNKGSNSSGSLFDKRFGVGSLGGEILKHGFDMVNAEKKATLEARWRNLQIRELELFVERNEMFIDLAKSMLESYEYEDK